MLFPHAIALVYFFLRIEYSSKFFEAYITSIHGPLSGKQRR